MAKKKRQESLEDYLESMLMLQEDKGFIRSVDVARLLGVTKPSVSYATRKLREQGFITMDDDGLISFTDEGLAIARKTYDKHKTLSSFFRTIGVDPVIAQQDACRIEHDISSETYEALCEHIEKVSSFYPEDKGNQK